MPCCLRWVIVLSVFFNKIMYYCLDSKRFVTVYTDERSTDPCAYHFPIAPLRGIALERGVMEWPSLSQRGCRRNPRAGHHPCSQVPSPGYLLLPSVVLFLRLHADTAHGLRADFRSGIREWCGEVRTVEAAWELPRQSWLGRSFSCGQREWLLNK